MEPTLTRAKFNELTAHLVEATVGPVKQAMADAGLTANDISKVLLVGGSSRIPAVQEEVKKLTGKEGFKGINPDECVAVGAAIQGGVLGGDVTKMSDIDVSKEHEEALTAQQEAADAESGKLAAQEAEEDRQENLVSEPTIDERKEEKIHRHKGKKLKKEKKAKKKGEHSKKRTEEPADKEEKKKK